MAQQIVKNGTIVKIPQLPFKNQLGEIYVDESGAEVYIPESDEHTSFNLKLPTNYSMKFIYGKIPEIMF